MWTGTAIAYSRVTDLFCASCSYLSWVQSTTLASRDVLQNAVDTWSRSLWWSGAAVSLGVLFELFELIYDIKMRLKPRMEANIREIEKPGWIVIIGSVGLLLVVAGVAGEWVSETKISEASRQLESLDSARIATAENGEKKALDDAKVAEDAASAAMLSATTALADGKNALQLAAKDERRAAALEKSFLLQGPRLPQFLKLGLAEFSKAIAKFPTQKVILATYPDKNLETEQLEDFLFAEFSINKWVPTKSNFDVKIAMIIVFISADANDATRKAAETLAAALQTSELIEKGRRRLVETVDRSAPGALPPDVIELYVGEHP